MSMKSPSPTRWWNNFIGPWVTLDFYLPLEGLAKWRGFKISPLFCWGGGGGGVEDNGQGLLKFFFLFQVKIFFRISTLTSNILIHKVNLNLKQL